MAWLVLKNRRHLGPFSEEALKEAVLRGRVHPEDYAVSVAQADAGDYTYTAVKRVTQVPESTGQTANPKRESSLMARSEMPSPATVTKKEIARNEPEVSPLTFGEASSSEDTAPNGMVSQINLNSIEPSDLVPTTIQHQSREGRRSSVMTPMTSSPSAATSPDTPLPTIPARRAFPWKGAASAVALLSLTALIWNGFRGVGADSTGGAKKVTERKSRGDSSSTTISKERSQSVTTRSTSSSSKSVGSTSRTLRLPETPDHSRSMPGSDPGAVSDPSAPLPEASPPPNHHSTDVVATPPATPEEANAAMEAAAAAFSGNPPGGVAPASDSPVVNESPVGIESGPPPALEQ